MSSMLSIGVSWASKGGQRHSSRGDRWQGHWPGLAPAIFSRLPAIRVMGVGVENKDRGKK